MNTPPMMKDWDQKSQNRADKEDEREAENKKKACMTEKRKMAGTETDQGTGKQSWRKKDQP